MACLQLRASCGRDLAAFREPTTLHVPRRLPLPGLRCWLLLHANCFHDDVSEPEALRAVSFILYLSSSQLRVCPVRKSSSRLFLTICTAPQHTTHTHTKRSTHARVFLAYGAQFLRWLIRFATVQSTTTISSSTGECNAHRSCGRLALFLLPFCSPFSKFHTSLFKQPHSPTRRVPARPLATFKRYDC